jgi:hypothetical protein
MAANILYLKEIPFEYNEHLCIVLFFGQIARTEIHILLVSLSLKAGHEIERLFTKK